MTEPRRSPRATRRMMLAGLVFSAIWVVIDHFELHHGWPRSIIDAVFIGAFWTAGMAGADTRRRRRGKTPFYPDGNYRENFRKGWAADAHSPRGWLGYALGFAAFVALGVVVLLTGGSIVIGVTCMALFGTMTVVSVTQAVRVRRPGTHSD